MDIEQMRKNGYDVLYLTNCALRGVIPAKEIVGEMDLAEVYRMAKYHSMLSVSYAGLERCPSFQLDSEILEKWKTAKMKILQKNIQFAFEREKIIAFMEEHQIWYLPLKGLILQKLYPQMGLRQMTDNDILFDIDRRCELRDFMVQNGYKAEIFNKGSHDVYLKKPYFNFEMHVMLYSGAHGDPALQKLYDYYKDPKRLLIKDPENRFGYHLSHEDFYIYVCTHAFRHYRLGGVGIRTLVDTYVYLSKLGDQLNWNYMNVELEQLGIRKFEEVNRKLAAKIFSKSGVYPNQLKLTEDEQDLLLFYITSGTYGSKERQISTKLDQITGKGCLVKWKYVFKRLFPDMEYYRQYAPFFFKHRILIPFYWIYKVFSAIFVYKKAFRELDQIRKADADKTLKPPV